MFINNITNSGYDLLQGAVTPAGLGRAGAALGVFVRSSAGQGDHGSAALSGIFGITEPAIYGVNLPRKRPFIAGIVGGVLGGILCGAMQVKIYCSTGAASVLALDQVRRPGVQFGLPLAGSSRRSTAVCSAPSSSASPRELVKDHVGRRCSSAPAR